MPLLVPIYLAMLAIMIGPRLLQRKAEYAHAKAA